MALIASKALGSVTACPEGTDGGAAADACRDDPWAASLAASSSCFAARSTDSAFVSARLASSACLHALWALALASAISSMALSSRALGSRAAVEFCRHCRARSM